MRLMKLANDCQPCANCDEGHVYGYLVDEVHRTCICDNPACSTNQSSAPSPRSDVGENDLGGGWVPVSERLPDADGLYLVSGGDPCDCWMDLGDYIQAVQRFYDKNGKVIHDILEWTLPPKRSTECESLEPPSAERGTPAVPEKGCSELEKAARELLRLKDIKERMEFLESTTNPIDSREYDSLRIDYKTNKDAAWKALRDVLNKEVGNV